MAFVHAADGTRIHYDVFGPSHGEPLVLIMGLAIDRWGWIRQRSALSRRFRCIAIDNRGSGLSAKPDGDYDLFTMAADVLEVMDAEGIESAHLMGYSLGGVLAQIIAVQFPERVRSLVLAATACQVKDWRRDLFEEWREMIDAQGMRIFALENLRWVAAARHLRWLAPVAPALAPLLVRAPARGVAGQIKGIMSIDEELNKELRGIIVPTLVVGGSQDILTPIADSEEIAHHIEHADFTVVAGAAHSLVVTEAGLFNRAVADFHDRVLSSRSP